MLNGAAAPDGAKNGDLGPSSPRYGVHLEIGVQAKRVVDVRGITQASRWRATRATWPSTTSLARLLPSSTPTARALISSRATTSADLDRKDIHVHLPGGGVTNDGPSAGAATLAALVSILTGKPVPGDVAVTGEVDLHGNVLPVGALPAKLISAQAGNIRAVLVPAGNNHDNSISVPVTNVREVLRHLGLIDQGQRRATRQPARYHIPSITPKNGPARRPRSRPRQLGIKR